MAHGADVDARDRSGQSPLERAVGHEDHEMTDLLRQHGAKE